MSVSVVSTSIVKILSMGRDRMRGQPDRGTNRRTDTSGEKIRVLRITNVGTLKNLQVS